MITPFNPPTCAALILVIVLVWRVWRVMSPSRSSFDHPALFFSLVFVCIQVLRLPEINWYHEINPDESQLVAQGARYLSHPVPWRDVDGTTSGPLNSMALSLPMYFGAPATWATDRKVLWVANCLTLLFLYLALRSFGTPAEAQLALIPTILFYAFVNHDAATFYSSETLPALLIAACLYPLAREWSANSSSGARLFFLGLAGGAVPFAKLQAAPLAMFLLAAGLARLASRCRDSQHPRGAAWRQAGMLFLGTALVPGLILGVVLIKGAFGDFWISYILSSGAYVGNTGESHLHNWNVLIRRPSDFQFFLLSGMLAMAGLGALLFVKKKKLDNRFVWPFLVMFSALLVTFFCVLAPGHPFTHYLVLLLPAVAILLGLTYFAGKTACAGGEPTGPGTPLGLKVWILIYSVTVTGLLFCNAKSYFECLDAQPNDPRSLEAQCILKVSQPGDTMSIWGWRASYHVETGLLPATRDTIGHYVVSPGPYQDYFRHRYLKDLEQSRPAIFVDAVVDGAQAWHWSEAEKHEGFPELARFIDDNYRLIQKIPLVAGGHPVRLYLLKERLAQLDPPLPAGQYIEPDSPQHVRPAQ